MELTREIIEFIRQATWGEGRCTSGKLQEQGQAILRDIASSIDTKQSAEPNVVVRQLTSPSDWQSTLIPNGSTDASDVAQQSEQANDKEIAE